MYPINYPKVVHDPHNNLWTACYLLYFIGKIVLGSLLTLMHLVHYSVALFTSHKTSGVRMLIHCRDWQIMWQQRFFQDQQPPGDTNQLLTLLESLRRELLTKETWISRVDSLQGIRSPKTTSSCSSGQWFKAKRSQHSKVSIYESFWDQRNTSTPSVYGDESRLTIQKPWVFTSQQHD